MALEEGISVLDITTLNVAEVIGTEYAYVITPDGIPYKLAIDDLVAGVKSANGITTIYETDWQSFTNQDLNSNPVDITGLEAQGAGTVIIPLAAYFSLDAGASGYDFGAAGIYLVYSSDTATEICTVADQAQINSGTDVGVVPNWIISSNELVTNDKIQLFAAADATQGTGEYYVKVLYKILETPF